MALDRVAQDHVVARQRTLHRLRRLLAQALELSRSVNRKVTVPVGNPAIGNGRFRGPCSRDCRDDARALRFGELAHPQAEAPIGCDPDRCADLDELPAFRSSRGRPEQDEVAIANTRLSRGRAVTWTSGGDRARPARSLPASRSCRA